MASKLRNASKAKISFFSFQDIITSVTGILILVTLMMTLYLNKAAGEKPAKADPRAGDEINARIQSLRQSNILIMAQINKVNFAPSESRLQEEKRNLESTLNRLDSRELNKIKAQADQHEALIKTNLQMQATSDQLQIKLEELQKNLAKKSSETNLVFVIKGLQASNKKPVIAVVSGSSLTVERLRDTAGARQLAGSDSVGQFAAYLQTCNPQKDIFVFIVRPSGIERFYSCRTLANRQGYDVGYEPIAEDLRFTLDSGGSK